ncbi:predicted protein [Naegleria gruberi]|uniref:Predicted protein n=1 Tax=Naegleria gruberi TaxID=5762 RepID=D2VAG8_NAEGR|nr:uncharacterized protein NAEGRDRAFT_65854 [Naegleria gruberi]EFC46069.1 predicted protein [Naegleria gruberi]|eukprot:XP_002678813.1 predicted protein [Naegleria gruberi strain NEG-M]
MMRNAYQPRLNFDAIERGSLANDDEDEQVIGANSETLDGQVPVENKEARILRIRETFAALDWNKDKKLDACDLLKVLKKIKAPKEYIDDVETILWEVCDNNVHNYLLVSDLEEIVFRVMSEEKKAHSIAPDRLVNIMDFVSKDKNLTGYISASQCILLLHNRFGESLKIGTIHGVNQEVEVEELGEKEETFYYDINDVIKNTEQAMNESKSTSPYKSKFEIIKRHIKQLSIWSKILVVLVIILVLSIFVAGITAIVFNAVIRQSYAVYFLASLYLLSGMTLIYFAIFAIMTENEYLLFAFLIKSFWGATQAAFMIYQSVTLLIDANDGKQEEHDALIRTFMWIVIFLIIVPTGLYFVGLILFTIILIPVYRSFGWKIYRRVGSSPELVRYYRFYCIYKSMIQVDIMCLTALYIMALFWLKFDWIPWSHLGLSFGYVFSILLIPISIYLGLKKEWYIVQIFVILFDLVLPIYLIYKLIEAWIKKDEIINEDSVLEKLDIMVIMTIITTFAVIVRILVIIFAIICTVNFRKGLKRIFERDFINIKKRIFKLLRIKRPIIEQETSINNTIEMENEKTDKKSSIKTESYSPPSQTTTTTLNETNPSSHNYKSEKKKKKKKKKKKHDQLNVAFQEL